MAKFSLTLINNRGATVLTQYDALTNETAGLTFDENLQLSVDGSTLSFSMLKYLYEGSQKVTNTTALSIIYGSIIRCEYNTKRYDFAVTDIKYNFMSENLRLDFTATDYFQFENSQIGVGYTITTDTTDPEYLGAMPIDEWVYKIIRDNNIRWTYTPINTANQEIIDILNNADERTALYKLDQEETVYWAQVEESKTLNTWVSFECSNSSAFAALKQLATDNELIIEVNYSNHSFCFKPQKSFIFNGYYFNPSNNLQAFSVQGNADNLITVLNITGGKDLNDQEITLVPSIPTEVATWINSGSSYTNITYNWLFTDWYMEYDETTSSGTVAGNIINNTDNNLTFTLTYTWYTETGSETFTENVDVSAHSTDNHVNTGEIPFEFQNFTLSIAINGEPTQVLLEYPGGTYPASIHSQYSVTNTFAGWDDSVYYPGLYDKYATNYPQFVREIAYTPWFENKLIDVSYFTNNNLLLPTEVFEIQDILYNQLRRINGHLIVAETTYLQKYEQDYMDLNQRCIDAETLGARLYGDVDVLTKPDDYTKPPIFVVKADNGSDLGPQNWVYIAPGSQLYAQTEDYNGIVDYNSLAYNSDTSISYVAPLYNYLGTTTNVTANVTALPIVSATWACTCNSKTLTLAFMSGTVGVFLAKTSGDGEVLDNRFGKYYNGFGSTTTTNTLSATITYPSNSQIRFAAQCRTSVTQKYFSTEAVFNIINGEPVLVSQTGFSTDPTLTSNSFSGSLSTSSIILGFEYEILELKNYQISSSTTSTLSYNNGTFRYRIGYNPLYSTVAVLDNVIYYQDQSATFLDFYGSISSCKLLRVDSTTQSTLPQYIYIKSDLPGTIQLYTEMDDYQSNILKITPDNIGSIVSTSLYESQVPPTPDHAIAGLADHLNSLSATRYAMLQHLADNWGYFQAEWNRSFTYDGSSYILGELYATYRQIGVTSDSDEEILAVDQRWSTSISATITSSDLDLLHLLLGVPDTRDLTRTAVIAGLQNIHTKFTEYWQQCYNAAMSLGIYWPEDWDCIDVLKTNKTDIDAILMRAMPLLYGTGIDNSDNLRWGAGSLILNYCFTPLLENTKFSHQYSQSLTESITTINLNTGATSSVGIKVCDLHISLSYKNNLDIEYGSINTIIGFTSTTQRALGSAQVGDVTVGAVLTFENSVWKLKLSSSSPNTTVNAQIDITLYQITDFSAPSSGYAESYKFLDDNNSYRPIYTPQVDNTQFIYQQVNESTDAAEPYSTILSNRTADDNLNLYHADLRYKEEHYTNFLFDNCKLPSQWLAAAVPFVDGATIKPTGASNDVGNPNLALITYLAKASQYNNTEYYEYLHQHNELWQHMHQQFPGVFRESNFTNTTAITSQELYESARRELDKVSQPAYQYSLTGMDIYMHDSDYEPTRIKLGDQIRIDYQELNELNDSLNAALREPLYITGITHTLRNDGDYQFTVTTRSATDTMLQRFANILMFK